MDEIQEMRSRVDSLERSLKRWQVVTLAAVLFCLIVGGVSNSMHRAMPAAGNATAEDGEFGVIRARRIEIAHPEGGSKIELFAIPSGAAIRIEGTKASTFLTEGGMSFSRRDVEADRLLERARHAQLNGEPDEAHWAAYRTYFEANPVSGVELGIGETGGGSLEIFNSLGKNVATVQCDKTNAGLILIKDQNGRAQLALPLK